MDNNTKIAEQTKLLGELKLKLESKLKEWEKQKKEAEKSNSAEDFKKNKDSLEKQKQEPKESGSAEDLQEKRAGLETAFQNQDTIKELGYLQFKIHHHQKKGSIYSTTYNKITAYIDFSNDDSIYNGLEKITSDLKKINKQIKGNTSNKAKIRSVITVIDAFSTAYEISELKIQIQNVERNIALLQEEEKKAAPAEQPSASTSNDSNVEPAKSTGARPKIRKEAKAKKKKAAVKPVVVDPAEAKKKEIRHLVDVLYNFVITYRCDLDREKNNASALSLCTFLIDELWNFFGIDDQDEILQKWENRMELYKCMYGLIKECNTKIDKLNKYQRSKLEKSFAADTIETARDCYQSVMKAKNFADKQEKIHKGLIARTGQCLEDKKALSTISKELAQKFALIYDKISKDFAGLPQLYSTPINDLKSKIVEMFYKKLKELEELRKTEKRMQKKSRKQEIQRLVKTLINIMITDCTVPETAEHDKTSKLSIFQSLIMYKIGEFFKINLNDAMDQEIIKVNPGLIKDLRSINEQLITTFHNLSESEQKQLKDNVDDSVIKMLQNIDLHIISGKTFLKKEVEFEKMKKENSQEYPEQKQQVKKDEVLLDTPFQKLLKEFAVICTNDKNSKNFANLSQFYDQIKELANSLREQYYEIFTDLDLDNSFIEKYDKRLDYVLESLKNPTSTECYEPKKPEEPIDVQKECPPEIKAKIEDLVERFFGSAVVFCMLYANSNDVPYYNEKFMYFIAKLFEENVTNDTDWEKVAAIFSTGKGKALEDKLGKYNFNQIISPLIQYTFLSHKVDCYQAPITWINKTPLLKKVFVPKENSKNDFEVKGPLSTILYKGDEKITINQFVDELLSIVPFIKETHLRKIRQGLTLSRDELIEVCMKIYVEEQRRKDKVTTQPNANAAAESTEQAPSLSIEGGDAVNTTLEEVIGAVAAMSISSDAMNKSL